MVRKVNRFGITLAALGALAASLRAEVEYPQGVQDFEAFAPGTDLATALPNWVIVNDSGANFTMVVEDDVMGVVEPRCRSTQWLRSTDMDGANVQNRYYSPQIVAQGETTYRWTWHVNLETTPPGGAGDVKPKLTIQHRDPANAFMNAWGIDFTATGANLIVLGIGGPAASAPLYPLSGATAVGEWVKIDLIVDFVGNTVSASVNNGTSVSLPINLNGNQNQFRFCYRGEGTGNVQTMNVDDVEVCVGPNCPQVILCPAAGVPGIVAMASLILAAGTLAVRRRRA